MTTTDIRTESGLEHDLGEALMTVARALFTLRVSPQTFDIDRRVDRAAYIILSRVSDMGPLRSSDLASTLSLDLSTISRQVRGLEDLGLLRRASHPDDRRASLLEATDEGRALVSAVKASFSKLMNAALANWSERDRRTLTNLLTRLAGDLRPDQASHLIASVMTDTETQ